MNGRKARAQRGLDYRGRPTWARRSGEHRCSASHDTDDVNAGQPCPSCGATR